MASLNHLPTDIVLDILTRLPTESILDCKLVCKPWRNLVSHHPSFYQMYLSHLNHSADPGKLSFVARDSNQQLHYFEYNDDETPIDCITRFNFTPPFTSSAYQILGSFNGLVCLYEFPEKDYATCVCNPVTREYVMLPNLKSRYNDKTYSSGFGYDSLIDEYKIVELYKVRGKQNIIEAMVYTLGSGKGWRNAGKVEFMYPSYDKPGVYANGDLHWIDYLRGMILVFDLSEEKFRQYLSLPPLPQDYMLLDYDYTIRELGGLLCCAVYLPGGTRSDIWLLKEKNDNLDMQEQVEREPYCWRKEFSLPGMEPLAFIKSGGVLCLNDSSLGVFDATTSTSKKLLELTSYKHIFPHKNTLVSLKKLGEEKLKPMKSETGSRDFIFSF